MTEETHKVIIYVREHDTECEFDFDIPCMLADEIRKVVKEFYEK